MMKTALSFAALAGAAVAKDILIVDFAGTSKATTHEWRTQNDPVMGGQSYSTISVDHGILNFTGSCRIVPKLQAPGFITVRSVDRDAWVDVSTCEGIKVNHMSVNDYKGFRISFGTAKPPGSFFPQGYKANINPPSVGKFADAMLPFNTFTDDWDDASGNAKKTCAENKIYCPTQKSLENFGTMQIWAEGVEGDISLLVKSISGYNCHRADGCDSSAYCCPDVKKCLTPGAPCPNGTCSDGKTCCPLTKLCVDVGGDCVPDSPCASDEYCCPDVSMCLKPTNPGVLCGKDAPCAADQTCCPLTNECVKVGVKCSP